MRILLFILLGLVLSCGRNNNIELEIDRIRHQGDSDPLNALSKLDSLEKVADYTSEYEKRKAQLLRIRLNDKACVLASSDEGVKELIKYFGNKGTNTEKQEVYYYAGSVYRDLMDFPRSIEYFLLSIEFGEKENKDSLMLRNCFSQLHSLYIRVQDYAHALQCAEKECDIADKLGILDNISRMHRVNAHLRLNNDDMAYMFMQEILDIESTQEHRNFEVLSDLLYSYSSLGDKEKASICYNFIRNKATFSEANYLSLAKYYDLVGELDSCIQCYINVLSSNDLESKYDASSHLFQYYMIKGDKTQALHYAALFNEISAELNLGKRQELAATVNNQYKYYRDKQEEEKIKKERRFLAIIARATGILCIIITVISIALFYYQKYKRARRLLGIANSLKITNQLKREKEQELFNEEKLVNAITQNILTTKEEKERIENELAKTTERITELTESLKEARLDCDAKMNALKEKEEELQQNKQTLHNKINDITIIDLQLQRSEQELREKTILLEEKLKQNESLFRMLHLSDLHGNASVVIDSIKKAADGKEILSDGTWKQFITAVDNLYPHYHNDVIDKLGTLKTEQLRVCYLLKAGLSNTQIQNLITDASRATIWRWIRRYNTLLSDSINSI